MKNLVPFICEKYGRLSDLISNSLHYLIAGAFCSSSSECISSSQNKELILRGKKGFASFIINGRLKNYSTGIDVARIVKLIKFIFGSTLSFFLHHFLLTASFLTSTSKPRTFVWSNNLGLIFLSNRCFVFLLFITVTQLN